MRRVDARKLDARGPRGLDDPLRHEADEFAAHDLDPTRPRLTAHALYHLV